MSLQFNTLLNHVSSFVVVCGVYTYILLLLCCITACSLYGVFGHARIAFKMCRHTARVGVGGKKTSIETLGRASTTSLRCWSCSRHAQRLWAGEVKKRSCNKRLFVDYMYVVYASSASEPLRVIAVSSRIVLFRAPLVQFVVFFPPPLLSPIFEHCIEILYCIAGTKNMFCTKPRLP